MKLRLDRTRRSSYQSDCLPTIWTIGIIAIDGGSKNHLRGMMRS
jgi:hypothetical protein